MLWSSIKKEFKMIFADKGHVFFLFIMPIIFIFVMSSTLSGSFSEDESQPVQLPILNLDEGDQAEIVIQELNNLEGFEIENTIDGEAVTKEKIDELIKDNDRAVALIFPESFSNNIEKNETAKIKFVVDPATTDQVLMPIEASVKSVVFSTIGEAKIEKEIEQNLSDIPSPFDQIINKEEVKQQIKEGFERELVSFTEVYPEGIELAKKPSAHQQIIPGYAIMFVFFIMNGIVESLMDERTTGTFRKIVASPVSKVEIIIGKLFPYYILNILQVVVMFAIGVIFYKMELGNSFIGLLLITLTLPLISTTLGTFISTVSKTKNQGVSIVVVLTMVLSAFGGIFVPAFLFPDTMKLISKYIPTGVALTGYQDVLVRGLGVNAVLNDVLILGGYALLFLILAIWKFKFEE